MDTLSCAVETVNHFLWGLPMICLLFGTHLYMTFRTGFIQRKLPLAIRLSFSRSSSDGGDISPFAALSTSLASTLGTGNIIGMGTAVALGGPGAVFWCWLTGIFGIATSYAESFIAIKYRVRTREGSMLGGAMYALEKGLHLKFPAVLFAVFGVLTSFGIGCAVQVNAISSTLCPALFELLPSGSQMKSVFEQKPDLLPLCVGVVTGLVTCAVILGGVRSVSRVCERLVPFMALFYLLGCAAILWMNHSFLPEACLLIVKSAFTETGALAGGLTGSGFMLAARYGISRGLFTNEAGMGSAPIIAAAARTDSPVRQALISSTATFWDTAVVCLITGLVLVSSLLRPDFFLPEGAGTGGGLTGIVFSQIPVVGTPVLIFGIITFAYATILGWSYYGERCLEYLFGRISMFPYRFLWIAVLVFAPVVRLDLVWGISDMLNALMALPNLTAVLLLSDVTARDTRSYFRRSGPKK